MWLLDRFYCFNNFSQSLKDFTRQYYFTEKLPTTGEININKGIDVGGEYFEGD